jgi:hypothetical protein
MPITLSKIWYDTRSIVHFEALEQTLRLRLVSGLVDKKCFLSRNSLSRTVAYGVYFHSNCLLLSKSTGLFLIFCIAVECEFFKLYFSPQLVLFVLCTFVLNFSTNTALYFESGSSWQICRDHLVTNLIRNTC